MRALSIFSFFVAIIFMGALTFSAFYMAPRFTEWIQITFFPVPLPSDILMGVELGRMKLFTVWSGIILLVLGLVLSLRSRWFQCFPRVFVGIGVTSTVILAVIVCWHFYSISTVTCEVFNAKDSEVTFYKRTLEEFAQLEDAEGRLAELKLKAQQLAGGSLRPITDPSKMNEREAYRRLNSLLRVLHETKDPNSIRRLLATSRIFSKQLTDYPNKADRIISAATKITGKSFDNIFEFYKWMDLQNAKDWQPVNFYEVGPSSKTY
jgi:hypothetical protein